MNNNSKIARIHLITDDLQEAMHAQLAKDACRAGVRWIQLRTKAASEQAKREAALATQEVCQAYNATLIIDDYVGIAKDIEADGVHLGKEDMHPGKARSILGDHAIIGGTANTFEDIQNLSHQPIDYIGCGPYRITQTKQKLSPIIGLEGYQKLMQQCHEANIQLPIIAIGGIQVEDVGPLLGTGLQGVAIASAINKSQDRVEAATKFVQAIQVGSK